jgi:hypothetical protein
MALNVHEKWPSFATPNVVTIFRDLLSTLLIEIHNGILEARDGV